MLALLIPIREELVQLDVGERVFDELLEHVERYGADMRAGQGRLHDELRRAALATNTSVL